MGSLSYLTNRVGKYYVADTGKQAVPNTALGLLAVKVVSTSNTKRPFRPVLLVVSSDQSGVVELLTATAANIGAGNAAVTPQPCQLGSGYASDATAVSGTTLAGITVTSGTVLETHVINANSPLLIDLNELYVCLPGNGFVVRVTLNLAGNAMANLKFREDA